MSDASLTGADVDVLHGEIDALRAEVASLREQLLLARDTAIGSELALGEALGRIQMLEQDMARYTDAATYLQQVLASNSWRMSQSVLAPVRMLRRRLAP